MKSIMFFYEAKNTKAQNVNTGNTTTDNTTTGNTTTGGKKVSKLKLALALGGVTGGLFLPSAYIINKLEKPESEKELEKVKDQYKKAQEDYRNKIEAERIRKEIDNIGKEPSVSEKKEPSIFSNASNIALAAIAGAGAKMLYDKYKKKKEEEKLNSLMKNSDNRPQQQIQHNNQKSN